MIYATNNINADTPFLENLTRIILVKVLANRIDSPFVWSIFSKEEIGDKKDTGVGVGTQLSSILVTMERMMAI